MLDILPALLWIIAAVIAVNICSITAIRGNLFSKKHRDVHPVRWSIIALHFTSLVIGALPYPVYAMSESVNGNAVGQLRGCCRNIVAATTFLFIE